MHLGLDFVLESLNSSPTNRLDPPIKDFFINRTISAFVKDEVKRLNQPDENKRVPFRILTYGDILEKYNNLHTLITSEESSSLSITDSICTVSFPEDLFRFEASYSKITAVNCTATATLPNVLVSIYDIIALNRNPFARRSFLSSTIEDSSLKIYIPTIYTLDTVGIIYIKKPAVLTSSPEIVNCDLPESVHETIVDLTAKFISAAIASGNYQQLLMEAKQLQQ